MFGQAAFAKVISGVPGEQVFAYGVWYYYNCTTSAGEGTFSILTPPQHGSVTLGSDSGPIPGCPAGSPSLPLAASWYTMNDSTPEPTFDSFQLNFTLNGTVYGPFDIYVVNGQIVGKVLGGPNTPNKQLQGEPIDVASGNVYYSLTDYTTSGQNPLAFIRYYNSMGNLPTQLPLPIYVSTSDRAQSPRVASTSDRTKATKESGAARLLYYDGPGKLVAKAATPDVDYVLSSTLSNEIGVNWRSNFDRFLKLISPLTVIAERPDGQQLTFTLKAGAWTPDTDVDMKLTNSGSQWTLTDASDTVEVYSDVTLLPEAASTSAYAELDSIATRNGYKQTLDYTNNLVSSVSDSYGRKLSFAYNNDLLQSVTTPDGLVIGFGYTAASAGAGNQLTSVTYSTTPQTGQSYAYGNAGLPFGLTEVIDEDGNNYTSWTYDGYSRGLTSQLGAGANATTLVYTSDTNHSVTNAFGVTDTYTLQNLQGVPKTTSIDRASTGSTAAGTETFAYDDNGYLSRETDWNGNETTFVNNSHGLPTTIDEAVGSDVARTTTITYDSTWVHLPESIETTGVTTNFTYDSQGELLTRSLKDTTTTTSPYQTAGSVRTWTNTWSNYLLASAQTPNGNTTTFDYDSTGALTSIKDALGHATKITSHTAGGLPETIVDPNGVTTTRTYDARLRVLNSTVTGSTGTYTTSWTYDAAGNRTKTTLPDNSALSNTFDSAHRLTQITDSDGNEIIYTLDALGDRTKTSIKNSEGTQTWQRSGTFDALRRELVETAGAGQTTTRTYDANGNVLTVEDGLNHTTANTYDALNRVAKSTDANSGVTTPAYDSHDRMISVTDANGNATTYTRDGFGDVIQQTSPDSGTAVFHYDKDANLVSKTDALGIVTNQTFDALDRPLKTSYPSDTTENAAYTYDQLGTGFSFGIGRLTSVTDAAGSLSRAYDELGNLLTEKRISGKSILVTGYTYDAAGRVASMSYPDGTLVKYAHDSAGYLSTVSATPAGSTTATTIATVAHEPFGPMDSVTLGNGIAENWTFDTSYRPTAIKDTLSSTALQNLAYVYDAANNVISITDTVNAADTQTLTYDVLNRISTAKSGSGGYGSYSWTYDVVGNRLTQIAGTTTSTYTYASGSNRLVSISNSTSSIQPSASLTASLSGRGSIPSLLLTPSVADASFYPVATATDVRPETTLVAPSAATASLKLASLDASARPRAPATAAIDYVLPQTRSVSLPASSDAEVTTIAPSLQFIPITPCRVADTRNTAGPFGGPELAGGASREFDIPQSTCNIPATAVAYSLNVTVVPNAGLGYLTLWPSGQPQPSVSTLNSDGRVKANAAITPAGTNGGVNVHVSDPTEFILDINGYFVPAGTSSALSFYPVTPCRIADTRNADGTEGGPSLIGGTSRVFPIASNCGVPSTAEAYSLNVTAVPHSSLGYLTIWPTGVVQPGVSTLNSSTGSVTANAAIVPEGTGGDVSVYASDTTDVILDVDGYFAPPSASGLSLYTATPCRALDTRNQNGAFSGTLVVNIQESSCTAPSIAAAYVLNATVVPSSDLAYLTLWPDGEPQPGVSSLNAPDGAVTSNMAIVPTTNGSIDAFAVNSTNLLLDLSSYFAPTEAPTPQFSIAPGTYTSAQEVSITDATTGATIYYTTDGSVPTSKSTTYTQPIAVSMSETLNAIAVATGYATSPVATAAYMITNTAVAPPVISPNAGSYKAGQAVTLSDATTGAVIYFTTDGSAPTTDSTQYTAPFTLYSTTTVNAIAATATLTSTVTTATFTVGTGGVVEVTTNANGNITSIPPDNATGPAYFTYNAANRLSSVIGTSPAASYTYDYAGKRITKTNPASTPIFYSYAQDGSLIAENNSGMLTDYVYADGRPIAALEPSATPASNQVNYILADHLGTPQSVVNSAGTTVWSSTYTPFGDAGSPASSIVQNLRMPGQSYDQETGFYHNGFRDYMPGLGRYLEADPIGFLGGSNDYLHTLGEPDKLIDPTGLCPTGTNQTGLQPIPLEPPPNPVESQPNSSGPQPYPIKPIPEDPGMVYSSVVCFPFCEGTSTTGYGEDFIVLGFGIPGASTSAVLAGDMNGYAEGWSLNFTPSDGIGPTGGFNSSTGAIGVSAGLGENVTFTVGIPVDTVLNYPPVQWFFAQIGYDYRPVPVPETVAPAPSFQQWQATYR